MQCALSFLKGPQSSSSSSMILQLQAGCNLHSQRQDPCYVILEPRSRAVSALDMSAAQEITVCTPSALHCLTHGTMS